MAKLTEKPVIATMTAAEKIRPFPINWDPVPDWIRLDDKKLAEFGRLQIQSKLKELELEKAKLEQLAKLM